MDRLNWDDARVFLELARAGTLSVAAQRLGSGAATVSRRIERLERALGVPLFLRHQSGYRLTDQGEALLSRAEAAEQAMLGLRSEAGLQGEVTGLVRLASIESLVAPVVVPALAPLLAQHQMLNVEVLFSVTMANLDRRDADLALRLVRPDRGHLVVRQVGNLGIGLYGPAEGETPKRFVTWPDQEAVQTQLNWASAFGADQAPRLAVNTLTGQIEAVKRGVGIAVLPHVLARSEKLRLLHDRLPDGTLMALPIYLAIHADLASSRRVRTVADCLIAAMTERRSELTDP